MSAKTILVVDDEQDIRELIRYNLAKDGFRVECVASGEEALRRVRPLAPDLIILDLMLPKMSGYEVCALLKQDTNFKNIPIVVFTARAQDSDRKLALEMGDSLALGGGPYHFFDSSSFNAA